MLLSGLLVSMDLVGWMFFSGVMCDLIWGCSISSMGVVSLCDEA